MDGARQNSKIGGGKNRTKKRKVNWEEIRLSAPGAEQKRIGGWRSASTITAKC